jgi:type I restriction enzyme S subunit
MRAGWEIKTIGDVCDIFDRKRKPISKRDREPGPYPYYGASCIQDYVSGYLFEGRYLLIGEDGAKWGPGEDTAYIAEGKFWVNNHAHIVKAKEGYLDDYLRYYIKHLDLNPIVAGAIIPKLTQEKLAALEVPIPSLTEQQRIVDILDQEFAKIDALKANAEKSLQAAKDLFQATLKKELEQKKGWKRIKLKDIAVVRVGPFGSSLHKNDYISGGTPLVNPIHMKDGQVVPAVDFSVNQEKLNELRSYILKEGDVVFARRGEIGRCALITEKEDGFLCGTGSLFVRFTRRTNSKFMLALFNSPYVKEQLLSKATGATMLNINSTSVENLEMYLPTETKQEEILSCIDDLNDKCRSLQENCQKTLAFCDGLKQSLLRKAFNGEIS